MEERAFLLSSAWLKGYENESMVRAELAIRNPIVIVLMIISLAFWTSYPLYLLKFGSLSDGPLFLASLWEGVVLLIPLPGIVGSAYAFVTGIKIRALLIGLVPYAPLLLLGYPLAVLFFIPGISNGLFGLASAILKDGDKFTVKALVVFIIGAAPWLYLVASLMR